MRTAPTDWDRDAALTTAQLLLEIKAINFRPEEPYTLTSGWKSPVYIDCRRIIFFPRARAKIVSLGVEKIGRHVGYESIDVVAGGETAGIPFAAWIADRMALPMAYVRKKPKGFGRNALIEGDVPEGKRTLLVEDLTTDGASKITFARSLRGRRCHRRPHLRGVLLWRVPRRAPHLVGDGRHAARAVHLVGRAGSLRRAAVLFRIRRRRGAPLPGGPVRVVGQARRRRQRGKKPWPGSPSRKAEPDAVTRRLLAFDSGIGGLSVVRELRALLPGMPIDYLADNAVFPYGELPDAVLVARVLELLDAAIEQRRPDAVVIACNTASTTALDALRARHRVPFIGCVPPIKWAAAVSRTRHIGLLATSATVRRPYLRTLQARFAPDCTLIAHGARGLADIAEKRVPAPPGRPGRDPARARRLVRPARRRPHRRGRHQLHPLQLPAGAAASAVAGRRDLARPRGRGRAPGENGSGRTTRRPPWATPRRNRVEPGSPVRPGIRNGCVPAWPGSATTG